jgi:radical SAM protein with 4Fe4S-binding SPASM domain
MLVTIFTNATMVTEEHVELLRAEPPYGVEVSIYGADAEHYEAVTGIPGSFARFERGIERLRRAGVDMLIKHPVSTLTADHVDAIRDWCTARGLRHKFTTDIERQHDGGAAPELYRLTTRKALDTRREIEHARTGRRDAMPMAECAIQDDDPESANRLYQCGAGRSAIFVDALGRASHCVIDREPAFPILEMPWDELWAAMQSWVNQPQPTDAPCSGCSLRGGCNNCPARARLATGSAFERDPHQCELTHVAHGYAPVESRPLGACVA